MRRGVIVLAVALVGSLVGCGGRPAVFGRVETTRGAPEVVATKEGSPALYAKGEALRVRAEQAWERGDGASAEIYAEHAVAAYRHAVATARLTAAVTRKSRESERLVRATEQLAADETSRQEVDREADRMEGEIAIRRDALAPTTSGPTDGSREAARWVAARANLATAEALCEGAFLLAPKAKGVAEARKVLAEVASRVPPDDKSENTKASAPIDASTRARALCLKALTSARDVTVAGGGPTGDALSAQITGLGDYDVTRDERGVVVTLSQVPTANAPFESGTAKLTKTGKDRLEWLGRVGKAHPTFAILVVAHSASGGGAGTAATTRDRERAEATRQALAAAGVPLDRIGVQIAGASLAAYDPGDPKSKAKNERIEVIFVGVPK